MAVRRALVAGILALTFCGPIAEAATNYTVTDLGNLGYSSAALAINNSGQIVGVSYANSAGSDYRAFYYDASSTGATMADLFGANSYSFAEGINDSGQVTGSDYGTCFVGSMSSGTWSYDTLSLGPSGSESAGYGINASGTIVGSVFLSNSTATTCAFALNVYTAASSYLPDPALASGSGYVVNGYAINSSGIVVGNYATSSTAAPSAFYDVGTTVTQIHTPADTSSVSYYATASGINDAGEVVGSAVMSSTATGYHAYSFNISGSGGMQDLGTLGGDFSWADGINSAGQIVGASTTTTADNIEHAFIYSGGTMMDLNSLIPASSGWDLAEAEAVNNSGWIVGYGVNSAGATDAFLLQPTVVHNLGDANGDGRVDVNDLTIVLSNYGQTGCTWSQGSMDGDPTGTVDINDLTIVLANYGATYGSASGVAAVPEPGAAALIAAGLVGLLVCVWRKRTA